MIIRRDEQGRPAEWVTETEPEFDVNERDAWYALAEYEAELCPECGNLRAICSDPNGVHGDGYYPQRNICYVTRARISADRAFSKKHEKAEPNALNGWLTDADGVTIWAATEDLTPEDDFL